MFAVNKGERKCIIGIAVPGDGRVSDKEKEKMEEYQNLKREIKEIWNMRSVIVVPLIVGALGSITKKLDEWLEKLDIPLNTVHVITNSQDVEKST